MPLTTAREAPRFSTEYNKFNAFFRDVDELATRAKLSDADTIDWAMRYAGDHADSWSEVPCMTEYDDDGNPPDPSFEEFRDDVRKCYPHLSEDRRHTVQDVERLVARTRDFDDMTREDLGDYHRQFVKYTAYLISKDRLSERERSSLYLRGFPQPVRTAIIRRMSIKCPDRLPEEGFPFKEIHEAALFILNAGRDMYGDDEPVGSKRKRDDGDQSVKDMFQSFMQVFLQSQQSNQQLPSQQASYRQSQASQSSNCRQQPSQSSQSNPRQQTSQSAPRQQSSQPNRYQSSQSSSSRPQPSRPAPGGASQSAPGRDQQQQRQENCIFCGEEGHFIRDCEVSNEYLRTGKAMLNSYGRVVCANGRHPPRDTPGITLKERIDNSFRKSFPNEPAPESATVNFLEGIDESVFAVDVTPAQPSMSTSPEVADLVEQIQVMQARMDSMDVFGAHTGGKGSWKLLRTS
jgi:hypothetical protein